jgi:hypothetical protein
VGEINAGPAPGCRRLPGGSPSLYCRGGYRLWCFSILRSFRDGLREVDHHPVDGLVQVLLPAVDSTLNCTNGACVVRRKVIRERSGPRAMNAMSNDKNIWEILTIAAALLLFLPLKAPAAQKGRDPKDAEVTVLIDQLSTGEEQVAKAHLAQMGLRAAPGLIATLSDLLDHLPVPRVGAGTDMTSPLAVQADPLGIATSYRYQVDWQVIADCVELLRPLRLAEAAPALVKAMERKEVQDAFPMKTAEQAAVEELGSPAVPALLDAIQHADELEVRPGVPAVAIRDRTAIALAEIGDPRAIPVIQRLIDTGVCSPDGFEAHALAKLKAKQGQ